ncbi:hypothetical protein J2R98_001953 [Alkalibacillus filiformis]|uniref:DinB-like domain-containing protein n=1 Tax=Alkalibacillus filiformis TaxID=200990 RepID=A0ABU0DUV4_9BACI|nr:DinB family protein [Alkalibacillus filiformis]MDQ0352119.1 hypothetical protein [Alkalibacillus filiformis]
MNEKAVFENANFWRKGIIQLTESMTEKELDTIPEGFNNNPRWNIGHVMAVWDRVITSSLGESSQLPEHYKELFMKGTSPQNWSDEIPRKEELISQLEIHNQKMQQIASGKLDEPLGFELYHIQSLKEAFLFLCAHESMHLATAKAQQQAMP